MSNDDFMSQLTEKAAESKATWEKIDGLIAVLEQKELTETTNTLFQLTKLLAEQLRPMGSEQDLEEVTQDIGNMLTDMVEKMKKAKK